eukprot:7852341-Pyramimonas_sp.AAC.1
MARARSGLGCPLRSNSVLRKIGSDTERLADFCACDAERFEHKRGSAAACLVKTAPIPESASRTI